MSFRGQNQQMLHKRMMFRTACEYYIANVLIESTDRVVGSTAYVK